MGQHKARERSIGYCLYCSTNTGILSKEHVLPFGLGGRWTLLRASCEACAKVTGQIEGRLLRKAWLPARHRTSMPSRRLESRPDTIPVTVTSVDGSHQFDAHLPLDQQNTYIALRFDPPAFLDGRTRTDLPAGQAGMKAVGPPPSHVYVDGVLRLLSGERVNVPVNLDAADVVRFVAKVAHCYAMYKRGPICSEYFLPAVVLGDGTGATTFVGCAAEPLPPEDLTSDGHHGLAIVTKNQLLVVQLQVFRDQDEPLPIYEAVVGRVPS